MEFSHQRDELLVLEVVGEEGRWTGKQNMLEILLVSTRIETQKPLCYSTNVKAQNSESCRGREWISGRLEL